MSRLYMKPLQGLANRMNVINSGLELSKQFDAFTVIWEKSAVLNCSFGDLFKPIHGMRVIETSDLTKMNALHFATYAQHWNSEHFRMEKNSIKRILSCCLAKEIHCQQVIYQSDYYRLSHTGFDFRTLSKFESVYLSTCWGFLPECHFTEFRPIDLLQEQVDAMKIKLGNNYIAVHIRRGDHKVASRYSPLSFFLTHIASQIKIRPSAKIFVASDDANIKTTLSQKFGSRVVFRSATLLRNSITGMQDALIDLYLLAGSDVIIGSFDSTFSSVASKIGKASLILPEVSA